MVQKEFQKIKIEEVFKKLKQGDKKYWLILGCVLLVVSLLSTLLAALAKLFFILSICSFAFVVTKVVKEKKQTKEKDNEKSSL